jgi:hypothetical protein
MQIEIVNINGIQIAVLKSNNIEITEIQDALDLMANCNYLGAYKIIVREKNILPAFFDLKTGLAGEILQKFSTYKVQLAIVGDFTKYSSKSLRDFIYESNKTGQIYFVNSVEEAKEKLQK